MNVHFQPKVINYAVYFRIFANIRRLLNEKDETIVLGFKSQRRFHSMQPDP